MPTTAIAHRATIVLRSTSLTPRVDRSLEIYTGFAVAFFQRLKMVDKEQTALIFRRDEARELDSGHRHHS
jgi:hypothetical protein